MSVVVFVGWGEAQVTNLPVCGAELNFSAFEAKAWQARCAEVAGALPVHCWYFAGILPVRQWPRESWKAGF
jgi:hypothetical protein